MLLRVLFVVALACAANAVVCKYGVTSSGDGTYHPYYDEQVGVGNPLTDNVHCALSSTYVNNQLRVAALNTAQYNGGANCGRCAQVTGPLGTIQVRIIDECATCASGDLDLSRWAFSQIANVIDGRVPITWRYAPCIKPVVVNNTLAYRWKDGSSQYWFGINVNEHVQPLQRVEIKRGSTWVSLIRQDYNYWLLPDSEPDFQLSDFTPAYIRLKGLNGEILGDTIPSLSSSQLTQYKGKVQFHNGCDNCRASFHDEADCRQKRGCIWRETAGRCSYRNI